MFANYVNRDSSVFLLSMPLEFVEETCTIARLFVLIALLCTLNTA